VRIEPTANVKLILQPDDGVSPLIKAIDSATKSIEIAIFRFDGAGYPECARTGSGSGCVCTRPHRKYESGGSKDLRKLEMDFLPAGIEVSRTADDLPRYHYKFMIIGRQTTACC
jgi:cardiolipin synthase